MTKKCLRRSLGLCLASVMALSSVTALGAGYGSIGLETTNVSGDLFNGTGSFESGIKESGTTGNSNLATGWRVFNGGAIGEECMVNGDKSTDGSKSVHIASSKYIETDKGTVDGNVLEKIFAANGYNGKYTIKSNFYKVNSNSSINYQLRIGVAKIVDATKAKLDKSCNWVSAGRVKLVSPTNVNFPTFDGSADITASCKPAKDSELELTLEKSSADAAAVSGNSGWYSTELIFNGTDCTDWSFGYTYNAYGYGNDGKYYGSNGKAYDTYDAAATAEGNNPLSFKDTYKFDKNSADAFTFSANYWFTTLMIQGNNGVYIDDVTITFAPAGDVKASDFAGKTMPVNTRVYNNSSEAANAVLITALYDSENMLKSVATKEFSFGANETDKVVSSTIDVPTILDEGYSIMTYAWKNLDTDITPLATMLDREGGVGNLIENGGFEVLPQSKGNATVAKNWRLWDKNTNNVFETVGNGADGSAYCVKLAEANKCLEYSKDKVTEFLNNNGVKGTYTLRVWYKYSGNDYPQLYALLRLGSYNNKTMQQEKSFDVVDTVGDWKCAEFNFSSNAYSYWDSSVNKSVTSDVSGMTNFAGRMYIKATKTGDILIDNVSMTFTPDSN